jgi:quinol-cytochrome oxidoreductase complex cytochrome b subunit
MSLLDKFMEKAFLDKPDPGFLGQLHDIGRQLVTQYAQVRGLPPGYLDRTDQWALGVYLFGLANGLGHRGNIPPIEVESSTVGVLRGLFGYDVETAERFVATWIKDLLTGDPNNVNYAIIHAGAEAYKQWRKGDRLEIARAVARIADRYRR